MIFPARKPPFIYIYLRDFPWLCWITRWKSSYQPYHGFLWNVPDQPLDSLDDVQTYQASNRAFAWWLEISRAAILSDISWRDFDWLSVSSKGGFLEWRYPNSWMVYNGKILLNWMICGYTYFRKPPNEDRTSNPDDVGTFWRLECAYCIPVRIRG